MKRNVLGLALVASLAASPGAFAIGSGSDMRLAQAGQEAGTDAARQQPMQAQQTQPQMQQGQDATDAARQQAQPQMQQGQQAAGVQDPNAPVLLIVPMQAETQQTASNGCWARLYDGENFTGSQVTLIGPVDLPDVDVPGRLGWANFDSAIVGPNARVFTYDDENYQDQTAVLNPGQRIADLDERKLGWFEEVESVQVRCTQ